MIYVFRARCFSAFYQFARILFHPYELFFGKHWQYNDHGGAVCISIQFSCKSERLPCLNFHDQGLIPIKTIAGMGTVNTTIGLEIIRTSPGHGTAFDIAGKGIADEKGMIAAIQTALKFSEKN